MSRFLRILLLALTVLSFFPSVSVLAQTGSASSEEVDDPLQKALVPPAPDPELQVIVAGLNEQVLNCFGPGRMEKNKVKQLQQSFDTYIRSRGVNPDSLGYLSLVFVRLWEMDLRNC